jgi:hypothetical protein
MREKIGPTIPRSEGEINPAIGPMMIPIKMRGIISGIFVRIKIRFSKQPVITNNPSAMIGRAVFISSPRNNHVNMGISNLYIGGFIEMILGLHEI